MANENDMSVTNQQRVTAAEFMTKDCQGLKVTVLRKFQGPACRLLYQSGTKLKLLLSIGERVEEKV